MPHLTIRGRALYYEWRGRAAAEPASAQRSGSAGGTPIIFLHDGLGAIGAWRNVPEHIADALGARALIFDRWGYGRSDPRPDFPFRFMEAEVGPFAELLRTLGIERSYLVGHSDGGSIALLFAAQHPAAVAAVVTEAAHVVVEPETRAGIAALVALQRQGRTPGWLSRLHGARADALLSAWAQGWLTDEHARWDITPQLPRIRCPVFAIQGAEDEFGTRMQVDLIRAGIADAESWWVPGSGHTPHAAAQADFEGRVIAFLAKHGARDDS